MTTASIHSRITGNLGVRKPPIHDRPAKSWTLVAILAAMWLGVVGGFSFDMHQHFRLGRPPYLAIVHVHAAVFSAWMVLFTVQYALAAAAKPMLHARLGRMLAMLVVVMVPLGLVTTTLVDRSRLLHPGSGDPFFFIIAVSDMIAFAGLAGTGLAVRRADRFAHSRLMLMAAIYISDAGFARLAPGAVLPWVSDPFWQCLLISYLFPDLLIAVLFVRDLVVGRRVHGVYRVALPLIAVVQFVSVWLYISSPAAQAAVRTLLLRL